MFVITLARIKDCPFDRKQKPPIVDKVILVNDTKEVAANKAAILAWDNLNSDERKVIANYTYDNHKCVSIIKNMLQMNEWFRQPGDDPQWSINILEVKE